ncbi:MAG: D-glycero-beta-D-manno-heptose 1,7-bisphosphate 7-phosphatase, partial [Clostridia bacterium]|nr:D-glycero-beta-D-manno-heptose 1,7-bisphosphate 7-phosphatase [Clostridia bacterium]
QKQAFSALSNAGIYMINKAAINAVAAKPFMMLDDDVVVPLIAQKKVFAYRCAEYVKDAGTAQRILEIERDIAGGLPQSQIIGSPKKAVFLDRDGTLNVYKGYIADSNEIELLPGVAEAVSIFHRLGYLVIVVTNQPVIARGECTPEQLDAIHHTLEYYLAREGSYLDAIYYCPHHPESGFAGERKEYKIECDCRKPKPGMILKAQQDFNIDLQRSYMAGDSQTDIGAALAAGCKPVLIGNPSADESVKSFDALLEFARSLEGK